MLRCFAWIGVWRKMAPFCALEPLLVVTIVMFVFFHRYLFLSTPSRPFKPSLTLNLLDCTQLGEAYIDDSI